MKVYRLIYNGNLNNYDRNGIKNLYWYDLKTIQQMIKKDKSKFKDDFAIVLEWYIKKFKRRKI